MKKKWETGRLDSKSLYIVTPKEIEVCISVPAEIGGLLSRVTIHAPAGSCAEQYAKENNIPFVAE